ncbi:MAG: alpha/beta fold hydrolase [Candidatus Korobacteraceae bacterium]
MTSRVLAAVCCLSSFFNLASAQDATPSSAPAQTQAHELTIEDIYAEGGLLGRAPESIKWAPDGSRVAFVQRDDSGEKGALYYVDANHPQPAVLVAREKLTLLAPPISSIKDERQKEAAQRYSVAAYHWSPDSKKLLFDSRGQLWLYNLDNGTAVQVTSSNDASEDPKFSPDGTRIAYVRKHNLYTRDVSGGREDALTRDDDSNLLNGEVDWVYEEELNVRSNYFWSPDGKQIAFLQMNEKQVPDYPITDWIPVHSTVDQQKYPQPGDANPEVRLGIVGAGGGKVKWLSAGGGNSGVPLGGDTNVYLPRFGWVRPGIVWAMALNRAQDRLDLYFIDVKSGKSQLMMSESSDIWIDMEHSDNEFHILQSGDRYLWTSWRDGYYHLYLYQFDNQNPLSEAAKLVTQVTHGEWNVENINGVDEQHGLVYFTANEDDWRQANVYAVGLDGKNLHRVSKQDGVHTATFDPANAKYYVDTYSSLTAPPTLSFCNVGGECSAFWKPRGLEQYNLPVPKKVEFTAADGTTKLLGTILLPSGGPMMANGKAPMIVNPYGGPGVQTVRDAWGGLSYYFDCILARQGFAVLHVDNRGMAGRGKAFAATLRHNLGTNELADQITAVKQALRQFPQIDGNRLGFWGWSYGGYFTLYTMTHTDMFKSGVAVAPVTDWRLYDSIYTERYMGLPKDNAEAYMKSSPVNVAADLKGNLLEIHGTSDDNVHFQNTVQMVNAFINSGKQFELMIYPRKTHGIAGKEARTHLFHLIDDHFEETLAPGK